MEAGDVLTHLMATCLVGVESTDAICRLLTAAKGKPLTLGVTKAWDPTTRELFPALVPLLKKVGLDVEELQKRYFLTKRGKMRDNTIEDSFNPLEDEDADSLPGDWEGGGLHCLYLGSVAVGQSGHMDRLGLGMDKVPRRLLLFLLIAPRWCLAIPRDSPVSYS